MNNDFKNYLASLWRQHPAENFKVGERVIVRPKNPELKRLFDGSKDTVIAINRQSDQTVEYALREFPYLVYEDELEKIE